jgi:hypothetical protein
MTLEVKRLHLASLQGVDGGRWPVHGFVVTHPGGAVLVVPVWRDSVRRIRSLRPERVHFCHHTDIVHG